MRQRVGHVVVLVAAALAGLAFGSPARASAAVPASCDPMQTPPLFGGGGNAEHYFAAVYDRAAMLAGALAAASGLLDLSAEVDDESHLA